MVSYFWSAENIATAARVYAAVYSGPGTRKVALAAAARAIGRGFSGVKARFRTYGAGFEPAATGRHGGLVSAGNIALRVPAAVLDERDRRSAAKDSLDLTGQRMGDPPPGYSALDRSRAAAI